MTPQEKLLQPKIIIIQREYQAYLCLKCDKIHNETDKKIFKRHKCYASLKGIHQEILTECFVCKSTHVYQDNYIVDFIKIRNGIDRIINPETGELQEGCWERLGL